MYVCVILKNQNSKSCNPKISEEYTKIQFSRNIGGMKLPHEAVKLLTTL